MSKTQAKDVFVICEDGLVNSFSNINKANTTIRQSVTGLQQQCMQSCENTMKAIISTQREFANKAGINTSIPDATLNAIRDTYDQVNNAYSIQNQMIQTTVDTTKQNIEAYNNNAKTFADLNKNIFQSWMNVFTPRN